MLRFMKGAFTALQFDPSIYIMQSEWTNCVYRENELQS